MSYLKPEQVDQLIRPINGNRVGKDGKNFSHVEAYELRAHLTRIFGFGRWSEELVEQELLFETMDTLLRKDKQTKKPIPGSEYAAWTVCWRSVVRVTVAAPDGTVLATYTEGATGEATNQPSRGDAHDLALKTSQSQAFKRSCANLGDQFGLGLYNKGSYLPLVGEAWGTDPVKYTPEGVLRQVRDGQQQNSDVSAHIKSPLAPENPPETPAPELLDSTPETPAPVRDTTPNGGSSLKATAAEMERQAKATAAQVLAEPLPEDDIRERALGLDPAAAGYRTALSALLAEANRAGVKGAMTTDAGGKGCTVEALLLNLVANARKTA